MASHKTIPYLCQRSMLVDPLVEIINVTSRWPRSLLIHTYLQIGDDDGGSLPEPFQRFAAALEKPFKRFQTVTEGSLHPAKAGCE